MKAVNKKAHLKYAWAADAAVAIRGFRRIGYARVVPLRNTASANGGGGVGSLKGNFR
jgi:hypothetical protein